MVHRVLADANVLFSRTLRDWLIMVEIHGGPYKTYWTEDILAETIYRLRRRNPTWPGAKISQVRDKIAGSLEGGRVDDFTIDGSFPGGDPDDQHVHAAALACAAGFILTADGGFTAPGVEDQLPYEVYRPDDFFLVVDQSAPEVIQAVARRQAEYWIRRHGQADLCGPLRAAGCPNFAERVRMKLLHAF